MLHADLQHVLARQDEALAPTDTLIITFSLIIHLSPYITGIQPLCFKGGFNARMGIDSFLGSRAGFIPPA